MPEASAPLRPEGSIGSANLEADRVDARDRVGELHRRDLVRVVAEPQRAVGDTGAGQTRHVDRDPVGRVGPGLVLDRDEEVGPGRVGSRIGVGQDPAAEVGVAAGEARLVEQRGLEVVPAGGCAEEPVADDVLGADRHLNGVFAATPSSGKSTINAVGFFASSPTSPIAVLTQRLPSWKPPCACSRLLEQSVARTSSGGVVLLEDGDGLLLGLLVVVQPGRGLPRPRRLICWPAPSSLRHWRTCRPFWTLTCGPLLADADAALRRGARAGGRARRARPIAPPLPGVGRRVRHLGHREQATDHDHRAEDGEHALVPVRGRRT